ncbi:toll/interleukin-1 receptor domain-containing protein [Kitasatospora viridis]|uniref:TIR domain-containing protein n=1 Tax=Kitasatospora viridis TaxID=281105 RepID=A0A561UI64_9ACTN|nr:toll/interleukin-1 receptor domain-containing protein [Kitasatospora viridis]TWF99034.1 TIR domain-containing protein [Kitasatospora viridis]
MPEIFVNYRTGDGDEVATTIERELSRRFGSERIFRASKSIRPGQPFPQELITAVRRSKVLLAVIGPGWSAAQTADGRPALADPNDWIRRELLEAFDTAALVIPILVGPQTRLSRAGLPEDLLDLADCQYLRYANRNAEADLARIGDELAEAVPELAAVDADRKDSGPATANGVEQPVNRAGNAGRDINQSRDRNFNVHGGTGTYVENASGPVNTGSGDQYNGRDPRR